ncbi:MAG TPA: cytochrome c [Terriglobales bacterium]|nr:cytochrome c [Terriglobales bacterium]
MRPFMVGLIIGLLAIPVGIYVYFATGMVPVETSAQAPAFETMLAKKALHARVDKEMPRDVPIEANESNYLAGAQIYRKHCAMCHGLPYEMSPPPIAKGEYPKPPELLRGKGVTDDPPGESYWKVANGIRLTGMPAYKPTLSTAQMWEVSILLANADKLPPSVQAVLMQPETASAPAAVPPAPARVPVRPRTRVVPAPH